MEEANKERIRAHKVRDSEIVYRFVSCAKTRTKARSARCEASKYVIRRKRRSSIINRAPAQSSALDENKLEKKKNKYL